MLPSLSPISLLITIATVIGAYYFYKYFLNAYLTVTNYRLQGAGVIWRWKNDSAAVNTQNAIEKGNYFHIYTDYVRKNPGTKWIVENNGPSAPANLVLVDANLLLDFLKKVDGFPKAPTAFTSGTLGEIMKGSIFFAEGDQWAWKRKILSPAFSFENLNAMVPVYIETSQKVFKELIRTNQLNNQLLVTLFTNISAESVGKFYFGNDYGTQQLRGLPISQGIKALLTDLLTGTNVKQAQDDALSLKIILLDIIKARQAGNSYGNDVLGLYLNLREKNPEDPRLGNDYILGEFAGLFSAGTDTVTYLLNSAVFFLWKYPQVYAKVKAEIDQEFSDLSKVNIESLNRMNYTTAFLKETMRLGGPNSNLFTRIALEDCQVDGFKIKKGTTVKVLNGMWYPYEKYFSSPEVFDPERFLGSNKYDMNSNAYAPFSTGPRICLGDRFAINEAKTILSVFVKTFQFSFPPKTDIILVPKFVYQPMTSFMVTLEKNE